MTERLLRFAAGPLALAGLGLSGIVGVAAAQEYCVACTGPTAVYRCQIVHAGPGQGQRQPLKLACVTALAKAGGHESCAVRDGTVMDCAGPVRQVDVQGKPPAGGPPDQAVHASAPAVAPGPGEAKPTEPFVVPEPKKAEETGPPQTVAEAVRRATKSTGETISNTGNSATVC